MKWFIIIATIVVMSILGCGEVESTSSRSPRETCRLLGYDDLAVDFLYNLVRADRDAGYSETQSNLAANAGCRGDLGGGCPENPNLSDQFTLQQCITQCSQCSTAVIADVYH